jgi:serine/threonine protein phosphatase PrpC
VNALEEIAMAAGGNDNITIVIISSPKTANVGSRALTWWRSLALRISQALAK